MGWRTNVPCRPRASIAPTDVSVCHASLTVVGDTPRAFDSSRTVGSRLPTGEIAARDHPPDGGGDAAGAAVLDGVGEREAGIVR